MVSNKFSQETKQNFKKLHRKTLLSFDAGGGVWVCLNLVCLTLFTPQGVISPSEWIDGLG